MVQFINVLNGFSSGLMSGGFGDKIVDIRRCQLMQTLVKIRERVLAG